MKIKSLQISNILSFEYIEDIALSQKIALEDGLNIVIGENGSGKSTALEVINFLFKRVFYKQYSINQDIYARKNIVKADEKNQIIRTQTDISYTGFRLEPNWNSESSPQKIRVEIGLDEIDLKNITSIKENYSKLYESVGYYTTRQKSTHQTYSEIYVLDIILIKGNSTFTVEFANSESDLGYEYLTDYNFFKEAILLHNLERPNDQINNLCESFILIGSYRNYHSFSKSISLRDATPLNQIQSIRNSEYSKSLNAIDAAEPSIFGMVRLRIADIHFGLISKRYDEVECESIANKQDFIQKINSKLKVVNLECKIKLIDLRTWQYSFEFYDLKRGHVLADINSLSAGQKAIIHLLFEAYGRGESKGGLILIDEPEIHLHYQFQNEYLQVIADLNREQQSQYILVTHSEALINSTTIGHVRRFSINKEGYTKVNSPILTVHQKVLIRILDNTRSTYAFFSKKVLLVEGDSDRYFFKSVLLELFPSRSQEIAVLYIGGKNNYKEWFRLFNCFGLEVFFVADFDFLINRSYPEEKAVPLRNPISVDEFKSRHPDWHLNIEKDYSENIYILKNGDLERYLGVSKGLESVIDFCNNKLTNFLDDDRNQFGLEIKNIMNRVAN